MSYKLFFITKDPIPWHRTIRHSHFFHEPSGLSLGYSDNPITPVHVTPALCSFLPPCHTLWCLLGNWWLKQFLHPSLSRRRQAQKYWIFAPVQWSVMLPSSGGVCQFNGRAGGGVRRWFIKLVQSSVLSRCLVHCGKIQLCHHLHLKKHRLEQTKEKKKIYKLQKVKC